VQEALLQSRAGRIGASSPASTALSLSALLVALIVPVLFYEMAQDIREGPVTTGFVYMTLIVCEILLALALLLLFGYNSAMTIKQN
jgi:hypothetical protein